MLAMTRDLLRVRDNYNVYYRRTVATYKAKSPIGDPPHLNKRVWAWLPYHKIGTSGALSAKWSMKGSMILTSSLISHTNHLVGSYGKERNLLGNCHQ